jgi:hypothetical protein
MARRLRAFYIQGEAMTETNARMLGVFSMNFS